MGKTKKNKKKFTGIGGKVIASGGYGCVFDPALQCEGSKKRELNKISKLMSDSHAIQEYEEINKIKKKLDTIPNYKEYFLIDDVTLCRPAKLTKSDLETFNEKCTALPKDDITKANINTKLDKIMSLNIPNGGLPVDDYIYTNGSFHKIYEIHNSLVLLLKNGILPMNKRNIYHSDIKDSNILINDLTEKVDAKLIDWGLTVEYSPKVFSEFPKNWKNRPLQFNVPFSVIIFTDSFYEQYSAYLKEGGLIKEYHLKPFVLNYLNSWMKERGAGHYKFINEIVYMLYSNTLTSVSEKNKPALVETEITVPLIVNYIIDVLLAYTKFKPDGSLNLREYLNNVYIQILDIWGFIMVYYPVLEMLYNKYDSLKKNELNVFNKIVFLFNEYLYKPRHKHIDISALLTDLNALGKLIRVVASNKLEKPVGKGITKKHKSNVSLFKRKKLVKKFKTPFFLSLK